MENAINNIYRPIVRAAMSADGLEFIGRVVSADADEPDYGGDFYYRVEDQDVVFVFSIDADTGDITELTPAEAIHHLNTGILEMAIGAFMSEDGPEDDETLIETSQAVIAKIFADLNPNTEWAICKVCGETKMRYPARSYEDGQQVWLTPSDEDRKMTKYLDLPKSSCGCNE